VRAAFKLGTPVATGYALHPAQRISNLGDVAGSYRRPEDIAKIEEGLRKAGLPE